MNRARNTAAFLLFITGGLHLISAAVGNMPVATAIITAVFGVVYLALGYFLLNASQAAVYVTAVVTMIGLLLSLLGLAQTFSWITLVFLLFDIAILAMVVYVLARMRRRSPAI